MSKMESLAFGFFLLIFSGFAAVIAGVLASAIGGLVGWYQMDIPSSERRVSAMAVGCVTFILLMLLACTGLLIWNPTY